MPINRTDVSKPRVDKWVKLRKTEHNKEVLAYKNMHPGLSLEAIGRHFSISRQRVHQIIKYLENQGVTP